MTSATVAAAPTEAESARTDGRTINGRTVMIHLLTAQVLWLGAIGFGIYTVVSA